MDFSNFSLDEIEERLYDKPDNIVHLKDFFGNKTTPPALEAGRHLTRDNLEAYKELAQRVIDAGKDSTGVQARRIRQIDSYLSTEGTPNVTGSS